MGDRRATVGSKGLGLGKMDYDSKEGSTALLHMMRCFCEVMPPKVPLPDVPIAEKLRILDDVETAEKESQTGDIFIRFGWMGDLDTKKDEEDEKEEEKEEEEDEVKITLAAPQLPHKRHDCLTHVFRASPTVWKPTSASGAPENSSLSRFSAMKLPSWLSRAAKNRHRHAVEQASHRWRGGRRDVQHEHAVKF